MEYNNLVTKLEAEREKFIDIINRIYTGDADQQISAVNDLDSRVFNERNKKLFLRNAKAMEGKERYSGKPYYVHCASTAYLISLLVDPQDENRDRAIGYALSHDFVDEACKNDPGLFREKSKIFFPEFSDELNAAVLLSGPRGIGPISKIVPVVQVQGARDKALAYTLVADKLDSQLDLEYMANRDEQHRKSSISLFFIAYPLFVIEELASQLPKYFVDSATDITKETMRIEGIEDERVKNDLANYRSFKNDNKEYIEREIISHQQNFAFRPG